MNMTAEGEDGEGRQPRRALIVGERGADGEKRIKQTSTFFILIFLILY